MHCLAILSSRKKQQHKNKTNKQTNILNLSLSFYFSPCFIVFLEGTAEEPYVINSFFTTWSN
jgi:hypothetical protein